MIFSIIRFEDDEEGAEVDIKFFESYAREREAFSDISRQLLDTHNRLVMDGEVHSYIHRTTDHVHLRTHSKGIDLPAAHETIVAIVSDNGFAAKKWHFEDRIIENSQGGQTHMQGWFLE